MRGTKERFAKYAPLLPQSQGITAVERGLYDAAPCEVCGEPLGAHGRRVFRCNRVRRLSLELNAAHGKKSNQTAARLGHLMVRALAEAGL